MERKHSFLKKFALATSVPVIVLLFWYLRSFLPHLSELGSISERGMAVKATVKPVFYRLAELGETKWGIRSYGIRQAYWSLEAGKSIKKAHAWHLNNVLWLAASSVHFNEEQLFGIWVECSLYGCGHGLIEASEKYFGKPIADLTIEELAGLVALVKSPQIFAPGKPKGEERKRKILEDYFANSSQLTSVSRMQ